MRALRAIHRLICVVITSLHLLRGSFGAELDSELHLGRLSIQPRRCQGQSTRSRTDTAESYHRELYCTTTAMQSRQLLPGRMPTATIICRCHISPEAAAATSSAASTVAEPEATNAPTTMRAEGELRRKPRR